MDGFWEEKSAPETSHLTFSGPIGLCSKIPDFVHWEVSARRLFTNIGYILLAGHPIDPILFSLHSQLQRDHFYAIGWCVLHLIVGFWVWSLNLGHRMVPTKEFDSAPIQPPRVASLDPSLGIRAG
jgi:hypothetical protein